MSAKLHCPEHPEALLVDDYQAGDMICPECGLVVGDRVIDVPTECGTYIYENVIGDKDNYRVRAAENFLFDENDVPGFATKWREQDRSLSKNKHSQKHCLWEMVDRLSMPKIFVDSTLTVLKQVRRLPALRAHSSDAIVAACAFIACRQDGVPQTFEEISAITEVSQKKIASVHRLILHNSNITMPIITPGDHKVDKMGLNRAHQEIAEIAEKLHLPQILVDRSTTLFSQVHHLRPLWVFSSDAVVSGCMYTACQQEGVPHTFKEMSAVCEVTRFEIERPRFCGKFTLPWAIEKAATFIARNLNETDLVRSWSDISVAATAIYMAAQASDEKKTAQEIARITGVNQVTIRRLYESILPKAVVLFPADFNFGTPVENVPTN